MYKVGDRVLFTFLGQTKKGVIIDKTDKTMFKVKSDKGTIYPHIHNKAPEPNKKGAKTVNITGYIIQKIED